MSQSVVSQSVSQAGRQSVSFVGRSSGSTSSSPAINAIFLQPTSAKGGEASDFARGTSTSQCSAAGAEGATVESCWGA